MKIWESIQYTSDWEVLVRDRRDFEKDLEDQTFERIKLLAILIRRWYDNTHWYADKKIERVNSIANLDDQFVQFFMMFDESNRIKLANLIRECCSQEEKKEVHKKLVEYFGTYHITQQERLQPIISSQPVEKYLDQEAIEVDEDNDRLILILMLALVLALGTFILWLLYNG